MDYKIVVMFSGYGSNFKSIIETINAGSLNCEIVGCITNHRFGVEMVKANCYPIPTYYLPFFSKNIEKRKKFDYSTRDEYDGLLAKQINDVFKPDLVVLAGWMHILGNSFLSKVENVINLHPALPGQFPGGHAIKDAFKAFQARYINHTGIMAHKVVEEIDAGETLSTIKVGISEDDTIDSLTDKIKYYEKGVLVQGIQIMMQRHFNNIYSSKPLFKFEKIYEGKVRTIYDIGFNLLAMFGTDKQSAFDKHICEIPEKGNILTSTSAFWFKQIRNLKTAENESIKNHYVYSNKNLMIVKKCKPIKVEVVLREYITGSTKTSLWTHYQNGVRNYCGIQLLVGLKKNQKLDSVIITPTTKDVSDEPISSNEVVERNLIDQQNWEYIKRCSLAIFNEGQKISNENNLILADTKYEFGVGINNEIMLIDELHTCDSSRFWLKDSYNQRISEGKDPERFDKDCVREYVNSICNPYEDNIPEIPRSQIEKAKNGYKKHYQMITGNIYQENEQKSKINTDFDKVDNYFENHHNKLLSALIS
jgi:phosphoribosylaminoimidazole-succinocarboxamide synthase/formyltetrahydrofolate-dependent phosphoribosylglycinamide formyltransferase